MKIGVPKEIKNHEYRVGLVPASVRELTARGHEVFVETQAGAGIGMLDEDYEQAGATYPARCRQRCLNRRKMIVKVKEPQAVERAMLRQDHVLYTYLHLAPDAPQTADLVKSGATCIAYETVTDDKGRLPLLQPMSEVAGRLSIQAGAALPGKSPGRLGHAAGRRARRAAGQGADHRRRHGGLQCHADGRWHGRPGYHPGPQRRGAALLRCDLRQPGGNRLLQP